MGKLKIYLHLLKLSLVHPRQPRYGVGFDYGLDEAIPRLVGNSLKILE